MTMKTLLYWRPDVNTIAAFACEMAPGRWCVIVGILSDSHGRLDAIGAALAAFAARDVQTVIHCGDIDTPEAVTAFRGWTTHFVLGNCDWDGAALKRAMGEIGATLHEPFGHLSINGVEIAWLHGDEPALLRDIENASHFDYLFYGHTHVAKQRQTGQTRVINPGALHRAKVKSCVVLDTATRDLQTLVIEKAN